jgi:hypothetical protein
MAVPVADKFATVGLAALQKGCAAVPVAADGMEIAVMPTVAGRLQFACEIVHVSVFNAPPLVDVNPLTVAVGEFTLGA